MGALYEKGRGVPQEDPRARELYTLACNAGVASGCDNLGGLFTRFELAGRS